MAETITINGETALFFPHGINWLGDAQTTIAYKTEIFTSYSGKEQRRALRSTPRRSWEFDTRAYGADFRSFQEALMAWHGRLFVLPEPSRSALTLSRMNPFALTMEMRTGQDWFTVGTYVVLSYKGEFALRRIDLVVGKQLRFETTDNRAWPVGTVVYPAMIGRFEQDISSRMLTSRVLTSGMDFMLEPLLQPYVERGLAAVYFDGVEVFTKRPNWATPLTVVISSTEEVLDYDRGPRRHAHPVPYNQRTQDMTFLNRNLGEADYVEGVFRRAKGRRGVFYAPTWTEDFRPAQKLFAGQNGFYSDSESLFGLLHPNEVFRKVALRTKSGELFFNEVVGASTSFGGWGVDWGLDYGGAGSTRVALRDPWPRDIAPEEVATFCWMPLSRFASDSLTFTFRTDQVSEFKMRILNLEDLYPLSPDVYTSGWGVNYGLAYGGQA